MKLIGERGKSVFDVWTVVHLAFWLVIGANMEALRIPHLWRWPLILVGAFAWEFFEQWLETAKPDWIRHAEGPWNRWVSDPAMGIIGGACGMYLVGG